MIANSNTSKERQPKSSLYHQEQWKFIVRMYTKLKIESLPQLVQEYDFFKKYDLSQLNLAYIFFIIR